MVLHYWERDDDEGDGIGRAAVVDDGDYIDALRLAGACDRADPVACCCAGGAAIVAPAWSWLTGDPVGYVVSLGEAPQATPEGLLAEAERRRARRQRTYEDWRDGTGPRSRNDEAAERFARTRAYLANRWGIDIPA